MCSVSHYVNARLIFTSPDFMSTSASQSRDLKHLHFSVVLFSDLFILFITVILTRKTTYYPGHGQLNDASIFCIYVFNHCATLRPSRFLNHSTRDIFVVYVVKILGHRTRCQDELLQHFNMNLALRACGL